MASPRALPRLLALARPYRGRIAVGTVFLALGSAMELIYPQLFRRVVDQALTGPAAMAAVNEAALAMLVVFGLEGVATGMRSYIFTSTGERVVADLRLRLYTRILAQEIAFFDSRRTGELVSRLNSDTTVLQNAVSVNISMLLRSLASAVGGIVLLFVTSARLTSLMLGVVPVVSIGAALFGRRIRVLARDAQDAWAACGEVAEETISGMRTVRAFAREKRETARYGEALQHALAVTLQRVRFVGGFAGAATFAGYGSIAIVLWYGGRLVVDGAMSVGQLTQFLLYTLLVAVSLGTLAALWTDFMRAVGATERVFELLERTPSMDNAAGLVLPEVRGAAAFEAVHFRYPARADAPVLHDVSFTLSPGETVALVGPSGGGKSTVAALLGRLYDPDSGTVRFDGHDLRSLSPDFLRTQVGVVAQDPALFSTTLADNIRYGRLDASDEEVSRAAEVANAAQFIAAFPDRYATLVGERGVQLSGGQRQRVAIARALLKDPRLLILDEATSALDAESEHLVKEALDRLMHNRTTLVIAHRLSTVRDASRVLVMEHGRIVQTGTHTELMQIGGLYRRLVERQFAG